MREQTPPLMELTVTEDPVTGTWTLTLSGHRIEIERAHGFVKVDGTLYPAPFVQGLQEVHEIAGEPLAQITRLLPTTPMLPALSPREHDSQRPTRDMPASAAPHTSAPALQDKTSERHTPKRKARAARTSTPTAPPQPHKDEPSVDRDERTVLPTEHAASYLGLSPKTLETLRTRGGGPPFLKLGRRVVYRKADLDTWLAAKVRRSTSDPGEQ